MPTPILRISNGGNRRLRRLTCTTAVRTGDTFSSQKEIVELGSRRKFVWRTEYRSSSQKKKREFSCVRARMVDVEEEN